MTTTAPATVEWIRFDTPLGENITSNSGELWQLDLSIDREEPDYAPFDFGARRPVAQSALATLGLVLPDHRSTFSAEAEIRRLHAFLSPLPYFGIEAAITIPGSPYNRAELPRMSPVDFAVTPRTTPDGKTALTFLTATVHTVASGRFMKLTQPV
jgi:hypothetical protein